jgi:hypothetical protein
MSQGENIQFSRRKIARAEYLHTLPPPIELWLVLEALEKNIYIQEVQEVPSACFINGRHVSFAIPQGLKPVVFMTHFGTTEVVPCYKAGL